MPSLTGDFYFDLITVLVALLAIGVTYVRWSLKFWERKNVAAPPPTFLFGNSTDIFLQRDAIGVAFKKTYQEMKNKGLKYCGYYFFTRPSLCLLDPELIKTVMTKDFVHFTDHTDFVNEKIDPLSGHLFSLKGQKWKNLRVKLTPTFTSGKMKMMFQTLVDCSTDLITVMDDMTIKKQAVDIKDVVGRFTTDIIGSCAFGIECNSLANPDAEFRKYGKKIFDLNLTVSIKQLVGTVFPDILEFFKIPVTDPDVTKFFLGAIKDTVQYREKNNIVRKDFMHLLIQLKNNIKIKNDDSTGELNGAISEEGKTLSIEELAAQAFVFFVAGFETSSTTLTFCFLELVQHQDLQEKLRTEINEVLYKHDGKITYDALMDMTYMDKCINETLRKYPPVPLLTRECTQQYTIPDSNVLIKKGTQVMIPIMGIQYDPEHYPDPDKFDPERFSPENKAKRHPYTWLPFGEGPRACIGLRFGVMQTKVALTVLLQNYKFTLNPNTQLPIVYDPKNFILSVKDGVWLNTEKIS